MMLTVMASSTGAAKFLGGIPGGEAVQGYLLKRMRRELDQLDESTLRQYLQILREVADRTLTGDNFEALFQE